MKKFDIAFNVCNVCGFEDSKVSNGDYDRCSECYSVEQGFTNYAEYEKDHNLFIDEAGILYDEDFNVVGQDND